MMQLLEGPQTFIAAYVDGNAAAASSQYSDLEIFAEYSQAHSSADSMIWNTVADRYGLDAAMGMDDAKAGNVFGQALSGTEGASTITIAGYFFVTAHDGTLVPIPETWSSTVASNQSGMVYQQPGSSGNANMIRVGDPNANNPGGYVRYYNSGGQPLTVNGVPGPDAETHIPTSYQGPLPAWPKK
jgi:hypothetical protein